MRSGFSVPEDSTSAFASFPPSLFQFHCFVPEALSAPNDDKDSSISGRGTGLSSNIPVPRSIDFHVTKESAPH